LRGWMRDAEVSKPVRGKKEKAPTSEAQKKKKQADCKGKLHRVLGGGGGVGGWGVGGKPSQYDQKKKKCKGGVVRRGVGGGNHKKCENRTPGRNARAGEIRSTAGKKKTQNLAGRQGASRGTKKTGKELHIQFGNHKTKGGTPSGNLLKLRDGKMRVKGWVEKRAQIPEKKRKGGCGKQYGTKTEESGFRIKDRAASPRQTKSKTGGTELVEYRNIDRGQV